MLILLSGFMRSGKSYIGQRLVNKLHFVFVDFDQYMEENIEIMYHNCGTLKYINFFLEKIHKYLFENYRGVVAHVHPDSEKICDAFEKGHVWYRCSSVDG